MTMGHLLSELIHVADGIVIVPIASVPKQLNAVLLICVRFDFTIVIENCVYLFVVFMTNNNSNNNNNK
jgi:hypothetical protein